jgi:ubiquinone/menaquinone biosynthesis C-methylase UbiE
MSTGYAPGHGDEMLAILRIRTAAEHAAFFLPYLEPGQRLLDLGCGEGNLTLELAAHVAPGRVVGVDQEASVTRAAAQAAGDACSTQVRFETGDAAALPFDDASFDRVFVHALLEHVPDPEAVLAEVARVLAPGGILGAATTDWGSTLALPETPALREAVAAHLAKRRSLGGDPLAARHTPEIAARLGLEVLRVGARFENESPPHRFAAYLARSVPDHAAAADDWPTHPGSLYSIAWVQVVARKPATDGP